MLIRPRWTVFSVLLAFAAFRALSCFRRSDSKGFKSSSGLPEAYRAASSFSYVDRDALMLAISVSELILGSGDVFGAVHSFDFSLYIDCEGENTAIFG
jgi:hypothetical protein